MNIENDANEKSSYKMFSRIKELVNLLAFIAYHPS